MNAPMRVLLLFGSCVAPAMSILLAVPFVLGAGPDLGYSSSWFKLFYWLTTSTVILGVSAAPAYVCAVLGKDLHLAPRSARLWLIPSLVIAAFASLYGAVLTSLAFWPLALFPLVSFVLCSYLLIAVRRRRSFPTENCRP